VGIAEFHEQEDDAPGALGLRQPDELLGAFADAAVLCRADRPLRVARGDRRQRIAIDRNRSGEAARAGAEIIPDDDAPGFLDERIQFRMVAQPSRQQQALGLVSCGTFVDVLQGLQCRGKDFEQAVAVQDRRGLDDRVDVAAADAAGIFVAQFVKPREHLPDAVVDGDRLPELFVRNGDAQLPLQVGTEAAQDVEQVLPGARRVQLDRQDRVHVKGLRHVEPPQVGEALDGVAGMGEDDAGQVIRPPRQAVFEDAADERAAVGLQVPVGEAARAWGPEEADGVCPRRVEKLFRGVGAQHADRLLSGFCRGALDVRCGVRDGGAEFSKRIHRAFLHRRGHVRRGGSAPGPPGSFSTLQLLAARPMPNSGLRPQTVASKAPLRCEGRGPRKISKAPLRAKHFQGLRD